MCVCVLLAGTGEREMERERMERERMEREGGTGEMEGGGEGEATLEEFKEELGGGREGGREG